MKKLFALMIALCLLGSVAMADDLVWEGEIAEKASQIDGEFHSFDEIAVKIWMPAVLKELELSDEDKEEGFIGYFETEDKSSAVSVVYVDMDGMTLEDYETQLKDNGAEEIEPGTVNGLSCLSYLIKEKDTACLAFTTEKGYILEVSAAPFSDEGFQSTLAFVLSSIQAE